MVVEKFAVLGGGCKTLTMGGHPYTFGPRHQITDKKYLFDFLNKYVPMRSCAEHENKYILNRTIRIFYNFPIHEDDIKKMPDFDKISEQRKNSWRSGAKNLGDYWLNSVGDILYEKFIKHYNEKMWMVDSVNEIDTFNWSPKGPSIASGKGKFLVTKFLLINKT